MKLLDSSNGAPPRAISEIKSNDVSTITNVLATATRKVAAVTAALGPSTALIATTIKTRTEAQDEDNHININCQAVIGAEEGATTAITDKVGRYVTDIVLRTASGNDFKGIEDYKLHKIFSVAITRAD